MDHDLPFSAHAAWWLGAWTRGACSPDEVLEALGPSHVVALDGTLEPVLGVLTRARAASATRIGVALPLEGELVGLAGPRAFNDAALESGEALVLGDEGMVPASLDNAVEWRTYPAQRRQPGDVREADRDLRRTVLGAADALVRLDVARWRPEVADELVHLRGHDPLDSPPGVPDVCVRLAGTALRMLRVVDLALLDDGGAVSATEAGLRREAVVPLGRSARRALVSACSPDSWPG